ncbi:MAG: response regulator [Acidobacteria bacterium]|nr:response regulator [Acidobacteriota bacterium]
MAEEEREKLQQQLTLAQKMESIGRLAGGIAHDFNNLLTVINGYSEVALAELPEGNPTRHAVEQIHDAGRRAANLTGQLLAFGRKQVIRPQTVDVNHAVTDAEEMLSRLIGADIELISNLTPHPCLALADPAQLHQVILNLAVNARDAMPEGGRLEIATANVEVKEGATANPAAVPGHYVQLIVSDTGTGMSEQLRQHIFEPFFTTKEQGKGTGLGLATVYGIVQQNNGWIEVKSEPGRGAAFCIFLPRVLEGASLDDGNVTTAEPALGDETVLVVEDEDAVRNLAKAILTARGYRVLEAANGEQAHWEARRHEGEIHLLLTDIVMPGMNGRVLSQQMLAMRPELRVVLMSGYAEDVVAHRGVLAQGVRFLQKPFTPDELAAAVRQALDAPDEG